jgi:acyl carrier protein
MIIVVALETEFDFKFEAEELLFLAVSTIKLILEHVKVRMGSKK